VPAAGNEFLLIDYDWFGKAKDFAGATGGTRLTPSVDGVRASGKLCGSFIRS
jgi:hypothetical protein